jgi:hypothetical protein
MRQNIIIICIFYNYVSSNLLNVLIGFGSFQQMKNCMPTPNKSLKDLLAKHFQLCIVDEFKTSKMCSFCLEGENPRPFREGMVNIHGLLTCTKCSKSSH